MYSKNDYRYYLENQLIRSDDYLAHYGVKGMKWKQHKAKGDPERVGTNVAIGAYGTNVDGRVALLKYRQNNSVINAQNRGIKQTKRIRSQQTIKAEQSRGRARTAKIKGSSEYKEESSYNSKKNNFPKSTVSESKKKKTLKQKAAGIRKKYGLYREKPKGKKLSGGGNIYVSHN